MRRRTWVIAALALLLLGGLALWAGWPREEARHPVVRAHPAPRRAPKTRVTRTDPPAPTEAPEAPPPEEAPLALLGEVDSADPELPLSRLAIYVTYPDGSPVREPLLLMSRDCRISRYTYEGPWVSAETLERACTLRVGRPDGRLFAWSDAEEVELSGGLVQLELVVPREQTGGLGVGFEEVEEGMMVTQVWPGSPAEAMGLSEGDVILEVDGLPTDTLTEDEFISVMTGPVGTGVDFVVGYDADTGWVEEALELTRARID